MTCIIIRGDNNGIVGIAANYKSAIKFLIEEDGLSDDFEIYSDEKEKWISLSEWRSNWKEYLLSCDIDQFNVIVDGQFYLEDYDIFNAAE